MSKVCKYFDRKTICILASILLLFSSLYFISGEKTRPIEGSSITLSKENIYIDAYYDGVEVNNYLINKPIETFSDDELSILFEKCSGELQELILNGNADFMAIESDLSFPQKIEPYPFNITYELMDINLIDDSGAILCDEQFDSEICIYLSYDTFEGSFSIPIHVEPDTVTEQRIKRNILENSLDSALNDKDAMIKNESGYVIDLPANVNGKDVLYSISGKRRNLLYLLAGPLLCVLIIFAKRKDAETEKKKQAEEILREYPKMIQKMSLFLMSGMTVRNIWILLSNRPPNELYDNKLYEEMRVSGNELRSGILESSVYKQFGERINIPEIVRFSALLSQNIKKGSTKLSNQLAEESKKAFENRKQRAIRKGEEAGTLLLGPMMMLLIDVMIMIILPAFWNI